jgi:hypothetical protein
MQNLNARLHLVLLFALPLAAQTDSGKLASIEGVVTNSVTGAPVPRAQVTLNGRYGATTSIEGKFSLDGIPRGSWFLVVKRVGFARSREPTQLTLEAGESKTGIEIKLTPTGAIVGRVTDADGQAVEGATVETTGIGGTAETRSTDEQGQFRLGGLAPGRYRVRASLDTPWRGRPEIRTDGTVEAHYAATYYPGALTQKAAGTVVVRPGIESAGIDIQLVRVPFVRVSGKVVGMPRGAENMSVVVWEGISGSGASVQPDGSFETWRLGPGKYSLTAEWNAPNGEHVETAPVEIEVAGSNIDDIELRLIPDSNINGRIEFEDDQMKQSIERMHPQMVQLSYMGVGSEDRDSLPLGDDGTFRLEKVRPGKYRLGFSDHRVYVKSMRLGTTAIDGALLDLSNGSGGADLTLLLSAATGSVSGTVQAGTVVVLTEAGEETGFDTRQATAGPDGTYTINNLPPGSYKLVAVSDAEPDNLLGYENQMETVEVGTGEKVTKDLQRRTPEAK